MKGFLALCAVILSGFAALGQDLDLEEGAQRAIAYWHSVFLQCGSNKGSGPWFAVDPSRPDPGSIQLVPRLRIQFKTEELSEAERLNGFEFKATTSLYPGPFRYWLPSKKVWSDWQVGETASSRIIIKRNGVWSDEAPSTGYEPRKRLAACSDAPAMEDRR